MELDDFFPFQMDDAQQKSQLLLIDSLQKSFGKSFETSAESIISLILGESNVKNIYFFSPRSGSEMSVTSGEVRSEVKLDKEHAICKAFNSGKIIISHTDGSNFEVKNLLSLNNSLALKILIIPLFVKHQTSKVLVILVEGEVSKAHTEILFTLQVVLSHLLAQSFEVRID
jgi:hypothetical protein